MTKTQKLKIQKIAQRFIALCYEELKRPNSFAPAFQYWINKDEFVDILYNQSNNEWTCTIGNCKDNTSMAIEI